MQLAEFLSPKEIDRVHDASLEILERVGILVRNEKARGIYSYGGCTSCVEVIADNGTRLILDGGSGIHPLGNKYMKEGLPENLTIFITHAHWDHIQGLPFFVPAFIPGNKMKFYGCNQGTIAFGDVLKDQMETPYFPVKLTHWVADIDIESIGETVINVNGIKVQSTYAEHPGMTLGYKLEYKDKSIVYLPDNEPFAKFDMEKIFIEPSDNPDDLDSTVLLRKTTHIKARFEKSWDPIKLSYTHFHLRLIPQLFTTRAAAFKSDFYDQYRWIELNLLPSVPLHHGMRKLISKIEKELKVISK